MQSVLVQALPANTGLLYVLREELVDATAGQVGDNRTTLAKVIGIIGAPTAATATPPAFSFIMPNARDSEDLRRIWIDAAVNGEGALVTVAHSEAMPFG